MIKNTKKINFRDQFRKCKKAGLVKPGEFVPFSKNLDSLPAFPNKNIRNLITNRQLTGFYNCFCGKFGGECSSENLDCKKMRNIF